MSLWSECMLIVSFCLMDASSFGSRSDLIVTKLLDLFIPKGDTWFAFGTTWFVVRTSHLSFCVSWTDIECLSVWLLFLWNECQWLFRWEVCLADSLVKNLSLASLSFYITSLSFYRGMSGLFFLYCFSRFFRMSLCMSLFFRYWSLTSVFIWLFVLCMSAYYLRCKV